MKQLLKKIWRQLFVFLSSLQLAVIVLLSLGTILAVGTFVESLHDADTARYYVYETKWFAACLGMLALNVFFAGLSRYPWKRHHTGFLTVHVGILIILAGSFVTLYAGFEGQLIIPEGETRHRIFLNESSLYLYDQGTGRLAEYPANFRFNPPSPDKPHGTKVFDDTLLRVSEFYPHAQMNIEVTEGTGEENPALLLHLEGSRAKLQQWLFARDFQKQRVNLGPASVSMLELPNAKDLKTILQDPQLRGPVLWVNGQWVSLRGNLNKTISVGDHQLVIDNFLPHGVVYQGELVSQSQQPINPVVKLQWGKAERLTNHVIYAKFGKMNSEHQQSTESVPIRLFWFPPELGKEKNELVLAKLDSGLVHYAIQSNGKWGVIKKVSLDKKIPTGWMDFEFRLERGLKRAIVKKKYRSVSVPKGKTGAPPAIRIQLAHQGNIQELWIGRGQSQDITMGSRRLKVAYARKSVPLGFQVTLNDFIMGTYEGTTDPASYESQVTLIDNQQGIREEHRIAMNQPLEHRQYKLFQASYQKNATGPDWTVLAVAYDPGIWIKYVGSIILILGIIIIFYFRRVYFPKPIQKRKRLTVDKDASEGVSNKPDSTELAGVH